MAVDSEVGTWSAEPLEGEFILSVSTGEVVVGVSSVFGVAILVGPLVAVGQGWSSEVEFSRDDATARRTGESFEFRLRVGEWFADHGALGEDEVGDAAVERYGVGWGVDHLDSRAINSCGIDDFPEFGDACGIAVDEGDFEIGPTSEFVGERGIGASKNQGVTCGVVPVIFNDLIHFLGGLFSSLHFCDRVDFRREVIHRGIEGHHGCEQSLSLMKHPDAIVVNGGGVDIFENDAVIGGFGIALDYFTEVRSGAEMNHRRAGVGGLPLHQCLACDEKTD